MEKKIRVMVLMAFILALPAGCQHNGPPPVVTLSDGSAANGNQGVSSEALDEVARMEQCRRELDALKKINHVVYEKRQQEFERLISGAGLYTGVRSEVSIYTQGAVDAYYRFRADKLCADISNDVLSELAKQ